MRPTKTKVSKNEMYEYYRKCRPWEPNDVRVGKFAKQMGYVLKRQMIEGVSLPFYIKKEALEEI